MTLSILLVEDEVMIRMMVADMVETLGHQIAAEAGNIDEAMELAQFASFDLAIIDINLKGIMSFPVAEAIASRQIPFILASGYGSASGFGQLRQAPVLQKPFTFESLENAIELAWQTETR